MTEAEWQACTDSKRMLRFLWDEASERKLRLFACACCRHFWCLLTDDRSRRAVEVAERFSDGLVSSDEAQAALVSACEALPEIPDGSTGWLEAEARLRTQHLPHKHWRAAATAAFAVSRDVGDVEAHVRGNEGVLVAYRLQAQLLRDIFGPLPFHPVSIRSQQLTQEVVTLAQSIYDNAAFNQLPRLADALENVGCEATAILDHCREPGMHVRGCWAVDFLLGKG